jgi:diguanylate cyclase (GGDEF)-like protein
MKAKKVLNAMSSTPRSWDNLLSARLHSPEISHERYGLILSRVRFVSRAFSVLSLLWIAVDFACWPWPASGALGLERVFIAGAFWILGGHRFESRPLGVYGAVLALLMISSGLVLGALFVLSHTGAHAYQLFGTQGYLLSPIALAAILAIFPLTARESVLLAASLVPVTVFPIIMWSELFATTSPMAVVLLLLLVAGISTIASLSQLNFLVSLVEKSATDGLTGAATRKFGERMLEAMFAISQRKNTALSVLFIDLDRFKSLNDRFGHGVGDDVLRCAIASIRAVARRQDVLVRWGGEEFVLIMPETNGEQVERFVSRLAEAGIGLAPDAVPITASMGASERMSDEADGWPMLVEAADRRMYSAKGAGRNSYVGPNGVTVSGLIGSPQPAVDNTERKARNRVNGDAASSGEAGPREITRMKELLRC